MRQSSTWKGAVAGALGGFVGSWVMNEFQGVWSGAEKRKESEEEPATVKTVVAFEQGALDRQPSESDKKTGSQVVHYGFGTAVGLVYGALAAKAPKVRSGAGMLFATSVWLGADEIAVPALKLGPSPKDTPVSKHIFGLASHLVYGLAMEGVRRGALAVMKERA
jgi:uncharacterized membrane protein YagU involved in acid resistance